MEGVPASILQSAQNVKVKLLSIIRGVSTVNYCLPTFRTPSPYPNNLSGTRWKRGDCSDRILTCRIKSICSPAKGGTGCYRFNYQPGS